MKKILSLLFDYQRFMQDDHLNKCIDSTEKRCLFQGIPLSDDLLNLNAAGDIASQQKKDNNTAPFGFDINDPHDQ